MFIMFEDHPKNVKSKFLKELEASIKLLKNIFNEILIDSEGIVYSLDTVVDNGRVICKCKLNDLFEIPKDSLLCLNSKNILECLKGGKTKILGLYEEKNKLFIQTTETDYDIGEYQENKKLNIDYLNDITTIVSYRCSLNELLERFDNKEFINIKKDKYDLILTHKLFPSINKCTDFKLSIKDNNDGTFYGIFDNRIEEKNKKEEITFEMDIRYIYKFIDLN